MTDKEFKTIDEQICILSERGLHIDDEARAREFLLRNNYYRISGYSLTLRTNDVFHKNVRMQNIIDIYEFDHELRHILLKYIESIEVTVKSAYSYEFTKKYGGVGYLNASLFTDPTEHERIIKKAEEQKASRLPHEAYLKHFVNDLKKEIPLWAYVDLFAISDISFLYKITEPEIKKAVSVSLGITVGKKDLLASYMKSMTIIRNLCAHGSRLYNRLFEQKPSLNKKEKKLLISKYDGTCDNSHLYGFILIMRRLLKAEEFSVMKSEIMDLTKQYPFVNMKYYGFRSDWKIVL